MTTALKVHCAHRQTDRQTNNQTHKCTQDFTMEVVHVVGGQASRETGDQVPPEVEAKCEISVLF